MLAHVLSPDGGNRRATMFGAVALVAALIGVVVVIGGDANPARGSAPPPTGSDFTTRMKIEDVGVTTTEVEVDTMAVGLKGGEAQTGAASQFRVKKRSDAATQLLFLTAVNKQAKGNKIDKIIFDVLNNGELYQRYVMTQVAVKRMATAIRRGAHGPEDTAIAMEAETIAAKYHPDRVLSAPQSLPERWDLSPFQDLRPEN